MTATEIKKGTYLGPDTLVVAQDIDNTTGTIDYGETRKSNHGVTGTGPIAFIRFNTTADVESRMRTGIGFSEVNISDSNQTRIAAETQPGDVVVLSNHAPSADAALVTNVNNVDSELRIHVNTSDKDGHVENVTLQLPDGNIIDQKECEASDCTFTLSATPPRSTWADGAYRTLNLTIKVEDNLDTASSDEVVVKVFIAGDANGDGTVDIFDAVAIGQAWNTNRGDSGYSDAADLNNDGTVDIFDAVTIGQNWRATATETPS